MSTPILFLWCAVTIPLACSLALFAALSHANGVVKHLATYMILLASVEASKDERVPYVRQKKSRAFIASQRRAHRMNPHAKKTGESEGRE